MSTFDLAAEPAVAASRNAGVEALEIYAVDFEPWVRAHASSLRGTAYLLTGDRQLAEDLVQTVLAKVSLRWERIVARGDPLPYVRTVLTRTAIKWRRRRWHGEVPTEVLPDGASTDMVGRFTEQHTMHVWLQQLPARQRAVIVLRFYADHTEAQTAEMLGCNIGTVKSHTARALRTLRTLIGAQP